MIKLSSIFLFSVMMTQSVMGSAKQYFVEDGFSGKTYIVEAPSTVSVLDLKKAIEDKTGILAKDQTLLSKDMGKPLEDDTIYTKRPHEKGQIIIYRKNIKDLPVSISFLGSHTGDVVPQSIVGDLQLEFAPELRLRICMTNFHNSLHSRGNTLRLLSII